MKEPQVLLLGGQVSRVDTQVTNQADAMHPDRHVTSVPSLQICTTSSNHRARQSQREAHCTEHLLKDFQVCHSYERQGRTQSQ
jgi:hypothetical protein